MANALGSHLYGVILCAQSGLTSPNCRIHIFCSLITFREKEVPNCQVHVPFIMRQNMSSGSVQVSKHASAFEIPQYACTLLSSNLQKGPIHPSSQGTFNYGKPSISKHSVRCERQRIPSRLFGSPIVFDLLPLWPRFSHNLDILLLTTSGTGHSLTSYGRNIHKNKAHLVIFVITLQLKFRYMYTALPYGSLNGEYLLISWAVLFT